MILHTMPKSKVAQIDNRIAMIFVYNEIVNERAPNHDRLFDKVITNKMHWTSVVLEMCDGAGLDPLDPEVQAIASHFADLEANATVPTFLGSLVESSIRNMLAGRDNGFATSE